MLALEGVFMIPALIIAAVLHERASVVALAETIAICFLLGGMGVLIFIIAVMPRSSDSGTGLHIMKAESPGPSVGKLVPKMRSNARILYTIYIVMTAIMTGLLIIFEMPVFDAVCISFGTAGTGGIGVLADSCASYTVAQQIKITVFMILFGISFSMYFLLLSGNLKAFFFD